MLRARRSTDSGYFVENVHNVIELQPFWDRGTDSVQLLVAHGQRAPDMAVFLYSVLGKGLLYTISDLEKLGYTYAGTLSYSGIE